MRCFILFLLLFFSTVAQAKNYYIDPSSAVKEEEGTKEQPWKNFEDLYKFMRTFRAGDSILLKRGELFFGSLDLKCSGTPDAPIIVTGYGTGNAPIFMYRSPTNEKVKPDPYAIRVNKSKYVKFTGLEITDDHIDPNNRSVNALIKIAFSIDESDFIIIQDCSISLVGIGFNVVGSNNLIDRCTVKNLRMVLNTQDVEYDDYGANGVVMAGPDNTISNCNFIGCWANSYDFEFDGGAIEMAGSTCKRNKIIHNTAMNCNGFMEFGSTDGGVIEDNIIEDNVVINCSDLIYINNDGPFKVTVQNMQLINNIFIQSFPQLTKPKSMISMRKPSPDKNIITMRGNIFWLPMLIDVARPDQFLSGELIHSNNIFYLGGGKLNFQIDRTERILNPSSPELKKISKRPADKNMGLYPFMMLLKYWYLII